MLDRFFRPKSESDEFYSFLLEQEGIEVDEEINPLGDNRLVQSALHLFKFVPTNWTDPRWNLARAYSDLHSIHSSRLTFRFHNAVIGLYLSNKPSYRDGYPSTYSESNIRQYARAVKNLSYGDSVSNAFDTFQYDRDGIFFRFQYTDSVSIGTNRFGVTGCPEALYQLQAWDAERYIGRVGFNVHNEPGILVVSINNIQGVPGFDYRKYYSDNHILVFNSLIEIIYSQSGMIDCGKDTEIRGIKNPERGDPRLYNSVFKKMGVRRMNAVHKVKYDDM